MRTGNILSPWCRFLVVATLTSAPSLGVVHVALGAQIGIYADENGSDCTADLPPGSETTRVYVVLKAGYLLQEYLGVQFAAPMPTCASYAMAGWSSASPGFLTYGDLESGIQVAFGGCIEGDIVVMSIDLVRTGESTTDCCAFRLAPYPAGVPQSAMVEVLDCSGQLRAVSSSSGVWLAGNDDGCAQMPPPSGPSPADGAADVGLDVVLDCELHPAAFLCENILGSDWARVYFGTSTDPPLVGNGGPIPFRPRSTAPGTTYYWRVDYTY